MPKFYCTQCGQHIDAPDHMAGMFSSCPSCGGEVQVPDIHPEIRPAAQLPPIHNGPAMPQSDSPRRQPAAPTRGKSEGSGVTFGTIAAVIVAIVLARACGSIVGRNAAERHVTEQRAESNQGDMSQAGITAELEAAVRLKSRKLPMMVDSITRLDSVRIEGGNTVVESYSIISITVDEVDMSILKPELQKFFNTNIKYNPEVSPMLSLGVEWQCKYYDKNGRFICSVST